MTDTLVLEPLRRPPDASVSLPGSKSITIRALLAAALADGSSTITNLLSSDDTDAMVGALRSLGFEVIVRGDVATVRGAGGEIPAREARVDLARSATSARLLLAAVALGAGRYVVDGHAQLQARPMGPGIEALRGLGVTVEDLGGAGCLPVRVSGGPMVGGGVALAGDVSSQFVSGLLMAGAATAHGVQIELTTALVSEPYVEMTRAVMRAFGVTVEGLSVEPSCYRASTFAVEPDASAASYFFGLAAVSGGRIRIEGLGRRSWQGDLGFVDVLERMGASVERTDQATEVHGTGQLHGVEVDMSQMSDTAPTLAVVASFADSPTRVTGVGFIRRKETDRIGHVVKELRRCGIQAEEEPDGFVVHPGRPQPCVVETYDDHRMAMSFALLGLMAEGITIADPACVAKTFPGYWSTLDSLR
jgi:3-phosphoshikimate 1-carboxyvinyltransferase